MAVERRKGTLAALLSVENGVNSEGQTIYKTVTINRVNPNITDEDLFDCASALADLQALPVGGISRRAVDSLMSA